MQPSTRCHHCGQPTPCGCDVIRKHIESIAPDRLVIYKGGVYSFGPLKYRQRPSQWDGFYGAIFRVGFKDGRVGIGTLWYFGTIPTSLRSEFPDNTNEQYEIPPQCADVALAPASEVRSIVENALADIRHKAKRIARFRALRYPLSPTSEKWDQPENGLVRQVDQLIRAIQDRAVLGGAGSDEDLQELLREIHQVRDEIMHSNQEYLRLHADYVYQLQAPANDPTVAELVAKVATDPHYQRLWMPYLDVDDRPVLSRDLGINHALAERIRRLKRLGLDDENIVQHAVAVPIDEIAIDIERQFLSDLEKRWSSSARHGMDPVAQAAGYVQAFHTPIDPDTGEFRDPVSAFHGELERILKENPDLPPPNQDDVANVLIALSHIYWQRAHASTNWADAWQAGAERLQRAGDYSRVRDQAVVHFGHLCNAPAQASAEVEQKYPWRASSHHKKNLMLQRYAAVRREFLGPYIRLRTVVPRLGEEALMEALYRLREAGHDPASLSSDLIDMAWLEQVAQEVRSRDTILYCMAVDPEDPNDDPPVPGRVYGTYNGWIDPEPHTQIEYLDYGATQQLHDLARHFVSQLNEDLISRGVDALVEEIEGTADSIYASTKEETLALSSLVRTGLAQHLLSLSRERPEWSATLREAAGRIGLAMAPVVRQRMRKTVHLAS